MKKNLVILSAFALILSIMSLGSLAYFTSMKATENEITTGTIRIDLHDLTAVGEELLGISEYHGVMPGDVIPKQASVTNTGGNTAWVRVKIIQMDAEDPLSDDLPFIVNHNLSEWTKDGEWYYYGPALEPGETSELLFDSVTFPHSLDNSYQNRSYYLNLEAEAVQVANNGTDIMDALGWPSP